MNRLSEQDALVMGQPRSQPDTAHLLVEQLHRLLAEVESESSSVVTAAEAFLLSIAIPASLPVPDVEIDNEELDLTWRNNGKLLRLITYPSETPKVYSQIDAENPFTRGSLVEADASLFSKKLTWLLS